MKGGGMTLGELMETTLIKDSDQIVIRKPTSISGGEIRSGKWYEDRILDWTHCEIDRISYDRIEGRWKIELRMTEV